MSVRAFLSLRAHFRRHFARYVFGILALLLGDTGQLIVPQILKGFVDRLEAPGATFQDLAPFAVELVLLALGILVMRFAWRQMVNGASRIIDYELRERLFAHLSRLSSAYFDQKKTGDLMAHATNDLNAIRMALGQGAVILFDAAFLITATIVIMVHTVPLSLTVFALLPLPLMALATERLGVVIHRRFLVVQNTFSDLTDRVQENFAGIRVIKGFAREPWEIAAFDQVNERYREKNLSLVRVWGLLDPLVDFISGLSFAITLAYGGMLVLDRELSLGGFVAFISYLGLLQWPMMAIGWVINLLQRGAASMERVNRIFAEEPAVVEAPDALVLPEVAGGIEFRHLTFRYPGAGRPALTDVSFRLAPGETLGIVGRTGAGKSTLVEVFLRLYDPPPGTVFLDGVDVRRLSFRTLRESVGYVPADSFLFSETIADNIAFGRDGLDLEAIDRLAAAAEVRDNILAFPNGYGTLVGERGVTLSGGQKQRIAIARALARDPALLILDDSLSAVDAATERRLLDTLAELRQGRTNLIIAHRISTVARADHIIVLDEGRIVDQGRHEELLGRPGLYRSLWERQQLEERLEEVSG